MSPHPRHPNARRIITRTTEHQSVLVECNTDWPATTGAECGLAPIGNGCGGQCKCTVCTHNRNGWTGDLMHSPLFGHQQKRATNTIGVPECSTGCKCCKIVAGTVCRDGDFYIARVIKSHKRHMNRHIIITARKFKCRQIKASCRFTQNAWLVFWVHKNHCPETLGILNLCNIRCRPRCNDITHARCAVIHIDMSRRYRQNVFVILAD